MHAAFQCQRIAIHTAAREHRCFAFFQLNVVAASLRHGTDSAAQHEDKRQRHERLHKSTEAVIAHERQHKHREKIQRGESGERKAGCHRHKAAGQHEYTKDRQNQQRGACQSQGS